MPSFLGEDMAIRLPKIDWALGSGEKEVEWLPRLAPSLPAEIPLTLATGSPGAEYPWPWTICHWLEGSVASVGEPASPEFALDLGLFVSALQGIDPEGGPLFGDHNAWRGEPLSGEDEGTREALRACEGLIDADAVTQSWERALSADEYEGPPLWLHGDLQTGNLILRQGRLSGVIDWGCLGLGDPACDLMLAWLVLPATTRAAFRAELHFDEATWARARGWALRHAILALPYYLETNPFMVEMSRFTIAQVLTDPE